MKAWPGSNDTATKSLNKLAWRRLHAPPWWAVGDAAEKTWQPTADLGYLTEWARPGAGEGSMTFQNSPVSLTREAFLKTTSPRKASATTEQGLNRETLVAIIVGKEEFI